MQYGSIGWSVPATLGHALGTSHRVITMVGDGSFQLTAQEVSTMIRNRVDAVLILVNNGGYTIEVEIHDGPYNVIKNWDYVRLVEAFNAEDGAGLGLRARTGGEFRAALQRALAHRDGPTLIEVVIGRDDCSRELLEWGARVARANGRAPR
jgi:indolepyruvate decarboxylase